MLGNWGFSALADLGADVSDSEARQVIVSSMPDDLKSGANDWADRFLISYSLVKGSGDSAAEAGVKTDARSWVPAIWPAKAAGAIFSGENSDIARELRQAAENVKSQGYGVVFKNAQIGQAKQQQAVATGFSVSDFSKAFGKSLVGEEKRRTNERIQAIQRQLAYNRVANAQDQAAQRYSVGQTGSSSSLPIVAGLMLLAGAGVVLYFATKK